MTRNIINSRNIIKPNNIIFRRLSYDKNNFINKFNLIKKNTELKSKYSLGIFIIGGCLELYTFYKSNDTKKSTGLGWSFIATTLIWKIR